MYLVSGSDFFPDIIEMSHHFNLFDWTLTHEAAQTGR